MVGRWVELARTENRVVRPRDFRDLYTEPGVEFARLADEHVLARMAHGYYALVPEERRLDYWKPTIEGVALGVAVADYGRETVALMGITAARLLGVVPRALAAAVVTIPKARTKLTTTVGTVEFVTRKIAGLEIQRVETDVTAGWVTTPEQTMLDLAVRPPRGGVTPRTVTDALRALGPRCDLELVARLATLQHKPAGWRRVAWVLDVPIVHVGKRAPTYGLQGPGDPADHGLVAE